MQCSMRNQYSGLFTCIMDYLHVLYMTLMVWICILCVTLMLFIYVLLWNICMYKFNRCYVVVFYSFFFSMTDFLENSIGFYQNSSGNHQADFRENLALSR
jgi:hypothetical protein